MSDSSLPGIIVRAVTLVFGLLAMYLFATALPPFLGLAGVLPRPASPAPIADALARMTLGGVCLVVIGVAEKLEQRFAGDA